MTVLVENDDKQEAARGKDNGIGRQSGELVRVGNLPETALYGDIRNFFRGIHIPDGGIKITGGQNCEAFVLFATEKDAKEAAKHDRRTLGGRTVRVCQSKRNDMREQFRRSVKRVLEFELKRPILVSNRKIRPTRLDSEKEFKSDVFRPTEIAHSGSEVAQCFGVHTARKIHPTSIADYQLCSKMFSPRNEVGTFKRRKVISLQ